MPENTLLQRTKEFSIGCAHLLARLPRSISNDAFHRQLIRASSSVGANYRAAQRAKSSPDFIYKLKVVEEELDESLFFLELLAEMNPEFASQILPLQKEADHLLRIFVASLKKLRSNNS